MIRASRSVSSCAGVGNLCRYNDNAWLVAIVLDGRGRRNSGHVKTSLETIDTTPDKCPALLRDGDRVMLAAIHVNNAIVLEVQGVDNGRCVNNSVVVAGALKDARATEAVETPGPDTIFLINREGMICARVDSPVLLDSGAKGLGLEGGFFTLVSCTLDDVVPKLVLLAGAPDKDAAFIVDGHSVICAARDARDFLELRQVNWFEFYFDFRA